MPATSRIAITPEASWINISRTVQNNKLYYRLSGIPDDSISPGTRYTVTVVDQGVTKTSFNITVINEEANCDFSIDVTNYTLTITNNNTPNTGHVYRVNWGHGNLEDFNPAVKTMSHTYMSTISATVSVEVIAKTPSGGVSLHKYVLNDGAPINIGDDQDEPGIGLIIHPNGASTETIWESSAKHIEFPPCPYKWEGHKFLYYAEDSHNWSNRTYMPGDTIDPNSLEEVWCIWEEEKVSGLTSTQILMIIAVGLFIVLIIARL
jgi:hypothetical protein